MISSKRKSGIVMLALVCGAAGGVFRLLIALVPRLHTLLGAGSSLSVVEIYVIVGLIGACMLNWFNNRNTQAAQKELELDLDKTAETLRQEIDTSQQDVIEKCDALIAQRILTIKKDIERMGNTLEAFRKDIDAKFDTITTHLIAIAKK